MGAEVYAEPEKLLDRLVADTKEILSKDEVGPDMTLTEIGIDSLNVVELIIVCEQIYDKVSNPDELKFDEFTTLRDMHKQLLELSGNWE